MKTLIILILLLLTACNGGTIYYYSSDLILTKDNIIKTAEGKKPNIKKVIQHGDFSGITFYEKEFEQINSHDLIKIRLANADVKNEYCIYMLSYFLPLNFWNIKSKVGYIKKSLKDQSSYELSFTNILIREVWLGTPIFSYRCIAVSGKITNETKK